MRRARREGGLILRTAFPLLALLLVSGCDDDPLPEESGRDERPTATDGVARDGHDHPSAAGIALQDGAVDRPAARGVAPSAAGAGDAAAAADRARALWSEGLALEGQGRPDEALDRFREAIAIGPYNEGWRYEFGSRFVVRRPLPEVEAYYREAVLLDPKPQTCHYFWGVALARDQQFERAVEHLQQSIEIDPAHEMSFEALGDIFLAFGDTEQAIAHYRQAVRVHPERRSSHQRLAELLESLGRDEEAARHRELARTSDPGTPRRFLYWGRALLEAGRVDAAIVELQKAVLALPDDEQARALLQQARGMR